MFTVVFDVILSGRAPASWLVQVQHCDANASLCKRIASMFTVVSDTGSS